MVYNYIFINTIDVNEREVEHELEKNPYVTEINPSVVEETAMADPILENYNVIAKIEAESEDDIKKIVKSQISTISGVEHIKIYSKPNVP